MKTLPIGKLPGDLLGSFLSKVPCKDPQVVVGPGIGEDVAVVRIGGKLLVAKTDPVTLAAELIGWYAVNINANDIATAGVQPRWFMATVLLPEKSTNRDAQRILDQMLSACDCLGVTLVGGHTEISYGLKRPIIVGCMLAEAGDGPVITAAGARVGDDVILTKGIAIEGTALLARESAEALRGAGVNRRAIKRAAELLFTPGISVLKEALIACESAEIHAMHDPTEGGLATGLMEVALASGNGIMVDRSAIPVLPETQQVCAALGLDPLGLLASGSLIIILPPGDTAQLLSALEKEGIGASVIGKVVEKTAGTKMKTQKGIRALPRFKRDELARFLERGEDKA